MLTWANKWRQQAYKFVVEDVIMPLIQAYKEIEDTMLSEDMRNIINNYHIEYLKYSWRVFVNLSLSSLSINLLAVFLMADDNPQKNSARIIVPMLIAAIYGIKFITSKYVETWKYVFPFFILISGTSMTIENTFFSDFKIHEIWVVFYFLWSLLSISIWFEWK